MNHLFKIKDFNNFFLDKFLEDMKIGNYEIRKESSKAICHLLTQNHYSQKRKQIIKQIVEGIGQSNCSYRRMTFFYFVENVCKFFSRNFFTIYFLPTYVQMINDKIPNIRQKFIQMIPKIRQKIGITDSNMVDQLIQLLNNSLNDKDQDVRKVKLRSNVFRKQKSVN